jgi:hypothetical protein
MWVKTQMGGLVNLGQFSSVQVQKFRGQSTSTDFFVLAFAANKDYEILFKGTEDECKKVVCGFELSLSGKSNKCDVMAIIGAGF